MNIYSNKQKWKIILFIGALALTGFSLFISNSIVTKVGEREKLRAKQWAGTIKKKIELVKLTNNTFNELREKERKEIATWVDATKSVGQMSILDGNQMIDFPMRIIENNENIPVVIVDDQWNISSFRNTSIDSNYINKKYPNLPQAEKDSLLEIKLRALAKDWKNNGRFFTIEVYKDLFMTCAYNDSKGIIKLEKERDSLIASFHKELIDNQGNIPVMLVKEDSNSIIGSNIDFQKIKNKKAYINQFKTINEPIIIDFNDGSKNLLYYDDSRELKKLLWYPYIQFLIIGLFVFIAYLLFSTFRKAEQNQLWAGMAKETAHQLGTPISSLMGWVQYLNQQKIDEMVVKDMQKDLDRLNVITDRFSKIGSDVRLQNEDLSLTITNIISYLKTRISDKVEIKFIFDKTVKFKIRHNTALVEWVIENIVKNAIDAMKGKGVLKIDLTRKNNTFQIDISDTGCGMSSKEFKTIFKPGYTTKKRGWGLGLALTKRIIEDYHKGKVFVLKSEIKKGTSFRIILPL